MAQAKESDSEKSSKMTAKQTTPWQYNNGDEESERTTKSASSSYVQPVTWRAQEYAEHNKNAGWFVMVVLASVGVSAIVYLIGRDLVSTVVILIIGIAFAAFAARKPQVLDYSLDSTGLHIGPKTYPYEQFRSFSILEDEPLPTIVLIPIKRFGLPISFHFDEADSEKIVNMLGSHLPGEQSATPAVDRLMTRIRF